MVKLTTGGKVVIGVAVALVLGAVLALVMALSHHAPTGFHNMTTLQNSVIQQEEATSGAQISSVQCVSTGANTASCNVQATDGQAITIFVNISSDGQNWVSH